QEAASRHGRARQGEWLEVVLGGYTSLRRLAHAGDHTRRTVQKYCRRYAACRAGESDIRLARAYRRGRSRDSHPANESCALFLAAYLGPFNQFAILAWDEHRAEVLPLQSIRQVSAHQHSGLFSQLGRI